MENIFINKAIYYYSQTNKYLTWALNLNSTLAQYFLGFIYYTGKYVERDVNNTICYLTLVSKMNNADAQCLLCLILLSLNNISKNFIRVLLSKNMLIYLIFMPILNNFAYIMRFM